MSPRSSRHGVVALALALVTSLAACSSGDKPRSAPQAAGADGGHTSAPALPSPGASGNVPSAGLGSVPSPDASGDGIPPSHTASAPAGGRSASPTPTAITVPRDVPTTASVSPTCVAPGGTVTLTVMTKPEAAIGWQAVYSNGYGGAQPPWGGGYGGNDKGEADANGRFTASWVVAPNAPSGTGHVDVVVGWSGKFGYADPAFTVGSC